MWIRVTVFCLALWICFNLYYKTPEVECNFIQNFLMHWIGGCMQLERIIHRNAMEIWHCLCHQISVILSVHVMKVAKLNVYVPLSECMAQFNNRTLVKLKQPGFVRTNSWSRISDFNKISKRDERWKKLSI